MKLYEINLFGVYVAPIAVLMVLAWGLLIGLRRVVARAGVLQDVWHPALFTLAIYVIVLSSLVLATSP
jgi:protein AaeX